MQRELNFYITQVIHLSLEDYHNAGIKPERTKEIIESLTDPGSSWNSYLRCEASGLNHNWNVHTMAKHPESIKRIVDTIKYMLEKELNSNAIAPQWLYINT